MKVKIFIAALLLMAAGLQTSHAQYGMQVWQDGSFKMYHLNLLDSMQFDNQMNVWHDGKLDFYFVNNIDSIKFIKHVTRITLSLKEITMWVGCQREVFVTALPVSADNRNVEWTSSNPDVALVYGEGRYGKIAGVGAGNAIITATAIDGSGVKEECQVTVISGSLLSCPDNFHPHPIDLGLPSGTKWACCNIGAKVPEGYGHYYAWGETNIKDVYDFDHYQYRVYNEKDNIWEYGDIGFDIAGTIFDVAHMTYPNTPWRMPTPEQFDELMDSYMTDKELNGVRGALITGNNGGQIFIPTAGKRVDDRLEHERQGCHLRTSQLSLRYSPWTGGFMGYGEPVGSTINLYSTWWYGDYAYRTEGWSVRAVCP